MVKTSCPTGLNEQDELFRMYHKTLPSPLGPVVASSLERLIHTLATLSDQGPRKNSGDGEWPSTLLA